MDFRTFVLYISEHYVAVVGTTLALCFTTCMILLIRSIGNRSESESGGTIDVTAIEGALKRVLATQPVSIAARPVADGAGSATREAAGDSTQSVETLELSLQARDAQIEKLTKELSDARAGASAAGGAGDAANAGLQDELKICKAKIEELQARLAEYEIIEDDIADLSMFKEENTKLKEELAHLKAKPQTEVAAGAPPSLKVAPPPEPVPEPAVATPPPAEAAQARPAPEDLTSVQAVEDPLAGDLNTSKMISEVESLSTEAEAASSDDDGSALEDLLDTDKLLAEVDSLKGASPASPEDDLLASFEKKAAEG